MSDRNDNDSNLDYWKTRLQSSLLKLHDEIQQTDEEDRKNAELFEAWQDQWEEKKELISQRLEMIEEHLERHFTTLKSRPELSLVGFHNETY